MCRLLCWLNQLVSKLEWLSRCHLYLGDIMSFRDGYWRCRKVLSVCIPLRYGLPLKPSCVPANQCLWCPPRQGHSHLLVSSPFWLFSLFPFWPIFVPLGQSLPPKNLTTLAILLLWICSSRHRCDSCVVRDNFIQTLPFRGKHSSSRGRRENFVIQNNEKFLIKFSLYWWGKLRPRT